MSGTSCSKARAASGIHLLHQSRSREVSAMAVMIPDDSKLLPAIPQSRLAREVLELVMRIEGAALANHSLRSYMFARLLAEHHGRTGDAGYDDELLFVACVLHDVGLTKDADRGHRFEVDGADFAADLLVRHGFSADKVDSVWQAIALNTSP